jgi:hypothetical protein
MWQAITEPHHLLLIIAVLILALILTGGTKGLSKIAEAGLSRLSGKTTEVNVEIGEDVAGKPPKFECSACGLLVDPLKCPMHSGEHERSLRNEEEIKNLWLQFGELGKEMRAGFKETQISLSSVQNNILTAMGGRRKDK